MNKILLVLATFCCLECSNSFASNANARQTIEQRQKTFVTLFYKLKQLLSDFLESIPDPNIYQVIDDKYYKLLQQCNNEEFPEKRQKLKLQHFKEKQEMELQMYKQIVMHKKIEKVEEIYNTVYKICKRISDFDIDIYSKNNVVSKDEIEQVEDLICKIKQCLDVFDKLTREITESVNAYQEFEEEMKMLKMCHNCSVYLTELDSRLAWLSLKMR